jgi:PAS domain S-box-containing protein
VIVLDSEDHVADVNQAASRMLGRARRDLVGRRAEDVLAPWPAFGACVRETDQGHQTVAFSEEPPRWLEVTASPLRDRLGRRAGRVVVARDVTERHRAGVRNILWSTDYPHSDSTWPKSREALAEHFKDVPADERALIAGGNAARLYRLN